MKEARKKYIKGDRKRRENASYVKERSVQKKRQLKIKINVWVSNQSQSVNTPAYISTVCRAQESE